MQINNDTMLLREEQVKPTDEVIAGVVGAELFAVYKDLIVMMRKEFVLDPQWRFYKDGQAWLCKVVSGKKTIFWLSLWQDAIRITFYFTPKTGAGISGLTIDKKIKKKFQSAVLIGKLLPLTFEINDPLQLDDLRTVISYKQKLK